MARIPKERREAERLREKIRALLAEPQHSWRHYEHIRYWLQKLLLREDDYYTTAEREAVDRIIRARTPVEGWAGFSVMELARVALQYAADFGYDDEEFLKEIEEEKPTSLVRDDMRYLVGLCIMSGMDIPRFPPRYARSDEDRFDELSL
jgi:hypothetical protein